MALNACIAFAGNKKIVAGSLAHVAVEVKEFLKKEPKASVSVFNNGTGRVIDLDLRGTVKTVAERYAEQSDSSESGKNDEKQQGPGRPKLGVVAREVTLLPRHWDWLATQPGGASVTLRKLVEEAKSKSGKKDQIRQAQEATHRFMTVMAGDFPDYEEALRAFYAKKYELFKKLMGDWPPDVREHILLLAMPLI